MSSANLELMGFNFMNCFHKYSKTSSERHIIYFHIFWIHKNTLAKNMSNTSLRFYLYGEMVFHLFVCQTVVSGALCLPQPQSNSAACGGRANNTQPTPGFCLCSERVLRTVVSEDALLSLLFSRGARERSVGFPALFMQTICSQQGTSLCSLFLLPSGT